MADGVAPRHGVGIGRAVVALALGGDLAEAFFQKLALVGGRHLDDAGGTGVPMDTKHPLGLAEVDLHFLDVGAQLDERLDRLLDPGGDLRVHGGVADVGAVGDAQATNPVVEAIPIVAPVIRQ